MALFAVCYDPTTIVLKSQGVMKVGIKKQAFSLDDLNALSARAHGRARNLRGYGLGRIRGVRLLTG